MAQHSTHTRLLPWTGPEGKPCYLLTDGVGGGYISRIADNVESVQLGMGAELLHYARELLGEPKVGPRELHYLSARLAEALHDALRVAESRGDRLSAFDDRAPDDNEDELAAGDAEGD
ncbi:hypothetical protein ACFXKR_20465 [Streptomyces violascens]|uniref:hypothetical protein n=1 Tax=Streptomyces violascens TaxID=67381 RepID=UPI0036B1B695